MPVLTKDQQVQQHLNSLFAPTNGQPVINEQMAGAITSPPQQAPDAPLPSKPLTGQAGQGVTGTITVDPSNPRVRQIFGAFNK